MYIFVSPDITQNLLQGQTHSNDNILSYTNTLNI